MNKNRKKESAMGPLAITLMVVTALSLGCTGIFRVVVKNRQVKISQEVRGIERRIKEHERDVTNLEIRLGQHANRFDLRERLEERGTDLRTIPQEAIVDLAPLTENPLMARNE